MIKPVLLVTPNEGFGTLIHQTLEDTRDYYVVLAKTGSEALLQTKELEFFLTILDADIEDMSIVKLGKTLRQTFPKITMILVPPANNFDDDVVQKLRPDGLLTKPFYLPDLVAIVEEALGLETRGQSVLGTSHEPGSEGSTDISGKDEKETPPPWLQDVNRAAQYLTRLTFSSSAQATLIIRGEKLWAYAGELPQPAAQELVDNITLFLERYGGSDLARFVRLSTTGDEYLVYATALVGDLVLALVFDSGQPFGKIRSQAAVLAKVLASKPEDDFNEADLESESASVVAKPFLDEKDLLLIPSDWQPSKTPFVGSQNYLDELMDTGVYPVAEPQKDSSILPRIPLPYEESALPLSDQEKLSPKKSEIPSPSGGILRVKKPGDSLLKSKLIPDSKPEQTEESVADFQTTVQNARQLIDGFLNDLPEEPEPSVPLGMDTGSNLEAEPPNKQKEDFIHPEEALPDKWVPFHAAETQPHQPSFSAETSFGEKDIPHLASQDVDETIPANPRLTYIDEHISDSELEGLEPAAPGLINLTYGCVLVPRFPNHHITGDLSSRLGQWLPQITVAFGWRVEQISTRPTYFQWLVSVPPETSPGYLIQIVRRITSQRIFDEYPRFEEANPSGDFWAPGYLITSSPHPPSARMIEEFITQTRKRQGFIDAKTKK